MEIGHIKKYSITKEMEESYLDYAMSVIISRALPDVRDGLKPVHRRILYAMHGLGLTNSSKYRKSATVIGECFVKDTLVLTDKGLIPIQNIKRDDKVYTQKGLQKITQLYQMPKKELLKITLQNGLSNTVTSSQKFKVIDKNWQFKWKEAKDLSLDDYLVTRAFYPEIKSLVKLNKNQKDFPNYLNKNIAYFLGLFMSDGWISEDYGDKKNPRIGIANSDLSVIKKISSILKKEFGYNPTIEIKDNKENSSFKRIYSVRINRKNINDFFVNNFSIKGIDALTKEIPLQILRSPKNVIFSFISGLIDGDGCISSKRNLVHYGSISERLINQLLVLLQHQGVFGNKYVGNNKSDYLLGRKIKESHIFYNLEISGKNAVKLTQNLNLINRIKKERIKKIASEKLTKRKSWFQYDAIPYAGEIVFGELSSNHIGGGWYQNAEGMKFRLGIKYPSGCKIRYCSNLYNNSLSKTQIISWGIKEKLEKIGSKIPNFLNHIINNNIAFLKVSSIEKVLKEKTYDIQVAKEHEFLANGVVSHNCLGKYHPHGDAAVYDSLVRMAQDFSLRYPLIDGQGNFGSMDGDNAAAFRYTEVKMSKITDEMLLDIGKGTVDWIDNYDGTRKEPVVFPAKLPQLLLNGVMGIAVGMMTNIPPHNLGEIIDGILYFIDHPEATVKDLFQFIKGPDFPTGGEIYNRKGMIQAYSSGKGPIVIRAKTKITEDKKGKFQILVTEMVYGVNKANLIIKIADLVKNKRIQGIKDIRDESNKQGVRIVINLKNDAYPKKILNHLFKFTDLQKTFHMNMLALINGIQPQVLSLTDFLEEYIKHRQEIIIRKTKFELNQAKERAHILMGLSKALDNIDAVINTIKESKNKEEARKNLMKKFKFSDRQAEAILEMKLQTLAGLEQKKIKDELKEKKQLIKELEVLLKSPKKILTVIKKELKKLKEQYNDERRTKVYANPVGELNIEELVPKEDCIIILTEGGYIKRVNPQSYRVQHRGGKGVVGITPREEDAVGYFMHASTHDNILFFTDKGRVFKSMAYELPETKKIARGQAIVNILQLGPNEKVAAVLNISKGDDAEYLVMSTENGIIKRTKTDDFCNVRISGLIAIKLKKEDKLKWADFTSGKDEIMLVTTKGQSIRFKENDVRVMGRAAAGVKGINLRDDDKLVRMDIIRDGKDKKDLKILVVTQNGFGKKTDLKYYKLQKRGGIGIKTAKINNKTGDIVVSQILDKEQEDLIAISKKGQVIKTKLKSVSCLNRATQGVKIMKLRQGDKVVSVACI